MHPREDGKFPHSSEETCFFRTCPSHITLGILAHLLRMVLEPKYYAFRRWLDTPCSSSDKVIGSLGLRTRKKSGYILGCSTAPRMWGCGSQGNQIRLGNDRSRWKLPTPKCSMYGILYLPSWWLNQPIWKNIRKSKLDHETPRFGVNIQKNIWVATTDLHLPSILIIHVGKYSIHSAHRLAYSGKGFVFQNSILAGF